MVSEKLMRDMEVVRDILAKTSYSIVVVQHGSVLTRKQGTGIRPILEAIDELGDNLHGSIIGDRILGRASALLCVYSKVDGVYAPQATKTGIAVLIRAGIPGQTDELIPFIKNKTGDGMCPFEKMLMDVDSPEEAYRILKNSLELKK